MPSMNHFVFLVFLLTFISPSFSSMFPPHLDMGTMDNTVGVRFLGISSGSKTGLSVCGAGDVDGDKVKDFLIGAPQANSLKGGAIQAGQVYVLYGQQNTTAAMGIWGSDFNLSTLISSPLLGRVIDGAVANTYIDGILAEQEILMQMDFQMF